MRRTSARQVRTAVLFDISHIRLVSRVDYIVNACRGKRVLDLGCVGQGQDLAAAMKTRDWLHGQIVTVAQRVMGLDADAEGVSFLRKEGYNCIEGDAESLDIINFTELLGGRIDLVVAGDLMEHLSNPGRFLDGCRLLLQSQGSRESELMIAVPSPFFYLQMLAIMAGKELASSDHNCWYSPTTLSTLLTKHGFQVRSIVGYSYGASNRVRDFRRKAIRTATIPLVKILLHLAKPEGETSCVNGKRKKTPSLLWAPGIICTASLK